VPGNKSEELTLEELDEITAGVPQIKERE